MVWMSHWSILMKLKIQSNKGIFTSKLSVVDANRSKKSQIHYKWIILSLYLTSNNQFFKLHFSICIILDAHNLFLLMWSTSEHHNSHFISLTTKPTMSIILLKPCRGTKIYYIMHQSHQRTAPIPSMSTYYSYIYYLHDKIAVSNRF